MGEQQNCVCKFATSQDAWASSKIAYAILRPAPPPARSGVCRILNRLFKELEKNAALRIRCPYADAHKKDACI
jgi:hypothetical protein